MKVPQTPPTMASISSKLSSKELMSTLMSGWGPSPGGKYRHWDTLRRVEPPTGFTIEQYWFGQKMARKSISKAVPGFFGQLGTDEFKFCLPDPALEMINQVHSRCSGTSTAPDDISVHESASRYVLNGLMEEAISSSMLEGAATTRKGAKEMIRSGRKPASKGERMVLNNYNAMNKIRAFSDQPLSQHLIEQLHDVLMDGIDSDSHKYRQQGDGIKIYEETTNQVLYTPPSAEESAQRLAQLVEFANHETEGVFIPPVVKAIILHFWLAYIHPFTDGNGRTARALFYWYMLKNDCGLMEYVSISSVLKKAPAKYGKSFLYTETDENDLTYFILAQLKTILQAFEGLDRYLAKKQDEYFKATSLLKPGQHFNHRQIALLTHALKNPLFLYTVTSHKNSHRIAVQTSRNDLAGLVEASLLRHVISGKKHLYQAYSDIQKRLERLVEGSHR